MTHDNFRLLLGIQRVASNPRQLVQDSTAIGRHGTQCFFTVRFYPFLIASNHFSSTRIDDIEDGSDLRRGKPAAHIVYGTPKTITSANYVYFLQQEKIVNEFPPEHQESALKIVIDQMLEGHIGQGMDIYWRDKWICPTEKEYKKMVIQKTGVFFTGSLQLAHLLKPDKERDKKIGKQLYRLGEVMTILFHF